MVKQRNMIGPYGNFLHFHWSKKVPAKDQCNCWTVFEIVGQEFLRSYWSRGTVSLLS